MVVEAAICPNSKEPMGERNGSSTLPGTTHDDDEKQHDKHDSTSSFEQRDLTETSSRDDIVWHYLTFETTLPTPAHVAQEVSTTPLGRHATPSPCPDLEPYTSPFLWPERRKTLMTCLSCTATVFCAFAAGSYTSGIGQMTREWHVSPVAAEVGVTVFTAGFGVAPMFLAPFSELNGRQPVFLVTGFAWVVFQLICAVTPTFAGMLVARFLVGCASSTFSTMVGGVVSDIYHAHDRNTAMALFSCAALLGTGLGPLCAGFIAQHISWRWIFYVQVIMDGVLMVAMAFLFRETRGSVLLSRKAKVLNKWYAQLESEGRYGMLMPSMADPHTSTVQRIRWKVQADEERGTLLNMIRISSWRPIHMLFSEPVVFFFSLWVSFSWAVLYLTLGAIPVVFETTYHFNLEQTDAVFASLVIGSLIFLVVTITQEKLARRYASPQHAAFFSSPEGRLVFTCVESALLPIGCIWFAVTGAYPSVPWIVPAMGLACATMGIFSIYLCVFNYLADSYHRYASSAIAAQSFCRNLVGGAFPLFTAVMFRRLTFQGAGGLLGGLGFLLMIVPWVVIVYGPKIRARSRFASELANQG